MSLSKLTKYCACHAQWLSWSILFTHETLFTMRGLTRVIVQTHQILRLPRKMNRMIDPCHTWNAIYNARSNKCHCPNSPNTAPATKNESHDWSLSHMKRYLQCAEQQVSLSKLTKYCACHEKWISWLILVTHETLFTMRGATCVIVQTHRILRLPRKMTLQNFGQISRKQLKRHFQCGTDPSMIRPWSEHETVSPQPASQPRLLFELTTSIFYWKIQHFAPRLTFKNLPSAAPATKSNTWTSPSAAPATQNDSVMTDPRHIWNVIYNARNNRWHPPTSPNSAPATQNDSPKFRANFSKTAETSFPMRDRSEHGPTMIRAWNRQSATRLATEVTFRGHHEHFVLKNTTFRAPAIIPNFTEYCACHEKWQFNITKYCACHEKWHLNVTK